MKRYREHFNSSSRLTVSFCPIAGLLAVFIGQRNKFCSRQRGM